MMKRYIVLTDGLSPTQPNREGQEYLRLKEVGISDLNLKA